MTTLGRALGFVLALSVAAPLVARAEPPGPPDRMDDRPGPGPRLYLVLRMADELGLSDEKALAVSRILKDADDKREALHKKRAAVEAKIRDTLAEPKHDSAALTKLIDQASELHKEQGKIADDSFAELKKVLTVDQQAKLVLLRSRLHRHFRFHMRPPDGPMRDEGHHHHGPQPGPGPGPDGPPDDEPEA